VALAKPCRRAIAVHKVRFPVLVFFVIMIKDGGPVVTYEGTQHTERLSKIGAIYVAACYPRSGAMMLCINTVLVQREHLYWRSKMAWRVRHGHRFGFDAIHLGGSDLLEHSH
jgi:hypothetical protein